MLMRMQKRKGHQLDGGRGNNCLMQRLSRQRLTETMTSVCWQVKVTGEILVSLQQICPSYQLPYLKITFITYF